MPKIVQIDSINPDPMTLSRIGGEIRQGGLIAFPTDTFYGLAANPFDQSAISRLYQIKGRPASKPILLLIDGIDRINYLVRTVSPLAEAVMETYWPGPLTLVFEALPVLPDFLTAGTGTIGIRFPDAAIPSGLINEAGFPITATSANRSGEPSPSTVSDVMRMIGADLDVILDGGGCQSTPSTLLDLSSDRPRILREGKISTESLIQFFNDHHVDIK